MLVIALGLLNHLQKRERRDGEFMRVDGTREWMSAASLVLVSLTSMTVKGRL